MVALGQGYRVTLGGEPVNPGAASWSLAYGVRPQTVTLELTTARVERIVERGRAQFPSGSRTRERNAPVGPLTFRVEYPADPTRNVEQAGLFVIERGPGDGLNTETVTLADRRFLAPRTVVRRRYNIRKESGDRRLIRTELQPIQLGVSAPDAVFQRSTLDGVVPWTARRVLEDVLAEVFGSDGFKIPADVPLPLSDDVESLELWDQGDEALARLSALIPGLRFFVDYDGLVTVANVYDPRAVDTIRELGTQYEGDWRLAERDTVVPQRFRVYFDAEAELRWDFEESRTDGTSTVVPIVAGEEPRYLENVIINPLLELVIPSRGEDNPATLGEAVPVDDFLAAINALRVTDGVGLTDITQAQLRRVWMGQWAGFSILATRAITSGATSAKWSRILSAIRTHWRSTYRILPQWLDKIRGLRPLRAAILDGETGTRAKATVHTQWVQKITQLGLDPQFGARQHLENDDYDGETVSPFDVEILSADQGLFRIVPRTDEDGVAESYTLGKAVSGWPTGDVRDAVVMYGDVELDGDFSLGVVMSALKSTPNGIIALHKVPVDLATAARRLGVTTPQATGSDYELRATEDTARFAWVDDRSAEIEDAFYNGTAFPEDLLVNRDAVQKLADAHAARRLAVLLPRVKGTLRGRINGSLTPVGGLQAVTHAVTVEQDGGAVGQTILTMPGEVESPSVWSLMPEGVRRRLRGQVDR